MQAKCTRTIRIHEDGATRKYTPGEVITRKRSVEIAIEAGCGEEISASEAGLVEKSKPAPKNKAKAAPKNKSD
jgi:hypothetical protein